MSGNLQRTVVAGELMTDGIFNGTFEEDATGIAQGTLRQAFETPFDSTQRAEFIRPLANGIYPGMTGDSLVMFARKDLAAKPHVALRLRGGRAATKSGNTMILSLNVGNAERMATIADRLESQGKRRLTIDAPSIFGPMTREMEATACPTAGTRSSRRAWRPPAQPTETAWGK